MQLIIFIFFVKHLTPYQSNYFLYFPILVRFSIFMLPCEQNRYYQLRYALQTGTHTSISGQLLRMSNTKQKREQRRPHLIFDRVRISDRFCASSDGKILIRLIVHILHMQHVVVAPTYHDKHVNVSMIPYDRPKKQINSFYEHYEET